MKPFSLGNYTRLSVNGFKTFIMILLLVNQSVSYADILEGLQAYRQGNFNKAYAELSQNNLQNKLANYYLGNMYLQGYGVLKNKQNALEYFNKAAEQGVTQAQLFLAKYVLNKEKNPEKALYWFKKAAKEDSLAQLYCAGAYTLGYGIKKNSDLATKYLIEAAKKGNALAQYHLGIDFLEQNNKQTKKLGLIWLTKAANNHNPQAEYLLGQYYYQGKWVEKDEDKAFVLLESSAAQHYLPAYLSLSEDALRKQQAEKAEQLLIKVASDARAQIALAKLYFDKETKLYNVNKGFLYLLKAAQEGSPVAQKMLAERYQKGEGVEANPELAKQWQEKSVQPTAINEKTISQWLSNEQATAIAQTDYRLTGVDTWHNGDCLKDNRYNAAPQMANVSAQELYQPQFKLLSPNDIAINTYFAALLPVVSTNHKILHYPIVGGFENTAANKAASISLSNQNTLLDKLLTNNNNIDKVSYQKKLNTLYQQAILGESSAQFELGQLYHYGVGVSKNLNQALQYYQLAAEQQDIRANYNIALLYLEDNIEPNHRQKGIEWLISGALKGNAYAEYFLSKIYQQGLKDEKGQWLIAPDLEQSQAMLYLSAANHLSIAQYELANQLISQSKVMDQKTFHLVKSLYEQAANQGIKQALVPMAFYYAMSSNPDEQTKAFQIAFTKAHQGNHRAAVLLGLLYDRGIATSVHQAQAIYWYQKAHSNPVTDFILGTYYAEGKDLPQNLNEAKALLTKAAQSQFTDAYFNLAMLSKDDANQFIQWLDKAQQLGNRQAGLLLADYYLTQPNRPFAAKSQEIYQFFAEKGDKLSQLKLGYMYDNKQNLSLALKWYTEAAHQGQPIAQYLLGYHYQIGEGESEPDYDKARYWYQQAAPNYLKANVALGYLAETVDQDYQKAQNFYQKAGKDKVARYNLGLIYSQGKGQVTNVAGATPLFVEAANQGYTPAMIELGQLNFSNTQSKAQKQQALN